MSNAETNANAITEESLTKDEISLLLYLETRAVDHSGRVNSENMNADDFAIANRWNELGFLQFGRVASAHCAPGLTHWCYLSDRAMAMAHSKRRERANRKWESRRYATTAELQQAGR
jgi:hypothetical protein